MTSPASDKVGEPVAYLKQWFADGAPRTRADIHPFCEPWLDALNPKITPLYAHPPTPDALSQPDAAELASCKEAYALLFKRCGDFRNLVDLIFASTCPYNDGEPTFAAKVVEEYKRLCPSEQSEIVANAQQQDDALAQTVAWLDSQIAKGIENSSSHLIRNSNAIRYATLCEVRDRMKSR